MRSFAFLLLAAAACSAQNDGAPSPDNPGGGGGGNVSFGGAQDIGQFRAYLDRGELPPADSLDANGFFNEHFNEPAPADCGGALCLTPGLMVGKDWLTAGFQATLQIAVSTPANPADYHRLPLNLVVVVDHSGSMASDGRLTKVKAGLHTLVDNLQPDDRMALISFDDSVTTEQAFTDTLDREKLSAAIERLQPRGGTDIYAGLQAGFALLGEYPKSEVQNRVIFLSDGLATAGTTSRPAIMDMARTNIAKGIGLTTIGVGSDFDVDLMQGLAESGAGNYYFLEDAAAASEVFTEELDYFMSPLALDVRIDAAAGSGWTLGEAVGSRMFQISGGKGTMAIPAVFLASRTSQEPGEGRRGGGSMIFVHLVPGANAGDTIADLTLSYRAPGSAERITQHISLADPEARDAGDTPHLSGFAMEKRYAMYNAFLGLRQATLSAPSCAAAAVHMTRLGAAQWDEVYPDADIEADIALMDEYLANLHAMGAEEASIASCPGAQDPYYPEPTGDGYGDDVQDAQLACSATRPTAGWGLILVAVLLSFAHVRPRRVRRAS